MQFPHVLRLTPDLFTNLRRTPWAGEQIGRTVKSKINAKFDGELIGESWELSCDEVFLSRDNRNKPLKHIIAENPIHFLGKDYISHFGEELKLIVKLLESRMPLSFQVHPTENFSHLKPGESSKTESWLVLAAENGAGFYIGFRSGTTRNQIERALDEGSGRLKDLLQFVPVKPGDYFEIAPGVPHAVGPGVLVLEPQFVNQGSGGKTYRFWDWDRTYDEKGEVDPKGKPRELHQDSSLALLDLEIHSGSDLLRRSKSQPELSHYGDLTVHSFPSNAYYQLKLLTFEKNMKSTIETSDGFLFVECTDGEFKIEGEVAKPGQPFFVSAAKKQIVVEGKGKLVIIASFATSFSFN